MASVSSSAERGAPHPLGRLYGELTEVVSREGSRRPSTHGGLAFTELLRGFLETSRQGLRDGVLGSAQVLLLPTTSCS